MKYGEWPVDLGLHTVACKEMMFYQYLPIKMIGETRVLFEDRLNCFSELVGVCCCDFIAKNGLDEYVNSYVYLTAKYLYQMPNCSFNRFGWHSDGFMTNDINYVWCDKNPTIFNGSNFNLSQNDMVSIQEMHEQAKERHNYTYPDNSLLRLNQFNIHKVNEEGCRGMRTFFKLSFSKDKYDLLGNSHNYLLDYEWEMKERKSNRNIPQSNHNDSI